MPAAAGPKDPLTKVDPGEALTIWLVGPPRWLAILLLVELSPSDSFQRTGFRSGRLLRFRTPESATYLWPPKETASPVR